MTKVIIDDHDDHDDDDKDEEVKQLASVGCCCT